MRRSLSAAGFFPVCTETLKRAQRAASTYPVRQHHMHHSHTEENSRSSFTLQVLQSEKIQLFFDFQGWKFRFCRTKKKTFQDDLGYESELMDGKRPRPPHSSGLSKWTWLTTLQTSLSGSHCKKKKKKKHITCSVILNQYQLYGRLFHLLPTKWPPVLVQTSVIKPVCWAFACSTIWMSSVWNIALC